MWSHKSEFVARVIRTAHAITAVDVGAPLAAELRVAALRSVAPQTVVASSVVRRVHACVAGLIARVDRAPNTVAAISRRIRLADARVTALVSVTEQCI